MAGRALLMGVPEYEDDAIPDLGFVTNDLASVGDAFANIGYEISVLGTPDKRAPTHNSIIHSVNDFCRNGVQDGDIAVLYFSGHGVHHQGRDYLVPSDATLGDEILEQVMVPIDFAAAYEQSRASTILFFIDACRDGVDFGEKGSLGYRQWSQGKLETVRDQQSAHIFACGPGEVSRYIPGPDGFSLFSRALVETLQEPRSTLPLTFGRMRSEVQKRLDELADRYQKKRQNVRVVGESTATDGNFSTIQIFTGGVRLGALPSDAPTIDVEGIGDLTISDKDLVMLSYNQDGKAPWVEGVIPIIHILRSAAALQEPVSSIVSRLENFQPVGLEIPPIDLEAAASIRLDQRDLVLLPSGGEELLGSPNEISAIQVLYAASRLAKPVDEILEMLRRFEPMGIKLPDIDLSGVKGLMVDERDLTMLSMDLDGRSPWLQGDVPVVHILRAANYLQDTVGAVVSRLQSFGPCGIRVPFDASEATQSMQISEGDLRLLSEHLGVGGPWIDLKIPIGHVMYVAATDGVTIGEALDRFRCFEKVGFVLPDLDEEAAEELTVDPAVLLTISEDFDSIPPWLGEPIPRARLLVAANELEEPMGAVCERLKGYGPIGIRHQSVDMAAAAQLMIADEDVLLLAGAEGADPSVLMEDVIPIGHMLFLAHHLGESVGKAVSRAQRLAEVGFDVPELDAQAVESLEIDDRDLRLLSIGLDGERPWLEDEIEMFHILRAAHQFDESPGAVLAQAVKFKSLGYEVPEVQDQRTFDLDVTAQDLTALSRDLDGYGPWIGDEGVSVLHLMKVSSTLEESIEEVMTRLNRFSPFGIVLPEISDQDALSLHISDDDLIVLSQDLDAAAPWIGEQVPTGHVLSAACAKGEEVGKIIEQLSRFEGLGFRAPRIDDRGSKMRISREDLVLLSRDLDGRPPWVDREVPVIHLLQAANHLGEPVKATFERLQKLELTGALSLTPYFASGSRGWRKRSRRLFEVL